MQINDSPRFPPGLFRGVTDPVTLPDKPPYNAVMHLQLSDGRLLTLDRPRIVGVLNLTPDSFSDGGQYCDVDAAVRAAQQMVEHGADMLDIGGESTRPGSRRIGAEEQLRRVLPTIERLHDRLNIPLSIDTTLTAVADAALDAGASVINDVTAGRDDPAMFALAAGRSVPLILMHMRGTPATMQDAPQYDDVVSEVREFLLQRAELAEQAGLTRQQIIVDPGIGFGKTTEHNLQLLANLQQLVTSGYPVMVGASRKRFLGHVTGQRDAPQRDLATAATTVIAVAAGVTLLRVHDVAGSRQAADVTSAVLAHQRK